MKSKEEYLKEAEARLKIRQAELERLKAKMEYNQEQAGLHYEDFMKAVYRQVDEVQDRLEKLERASGEAWDVLKDGTEKALAELQQAIGQAAAKFQENGKSK